MEEFQEYNEKMYGKIGHLKFYKIHYKCDMWDNG